MESFVKSRTQLCRFTSFYGITLRFTALHFPATLVPSWVTREDMLPLGGGCVVAKVWQDHIAAQVTWKGFWGMREPEALLWSHFVFLLRGEGWGRAGGVTQRNRAKRSSVRVQQEVQKRDDINPRVPFPASLSILWYLFPSCHFSWFQPPAPARLWTLSPPSIHPLSPFTCRLLFCSFLSLHLSYIPMVHLGCGCQPQTHSYYYPGGSFRLQFSMRKISATRKEYKNIYISR